MRNIHYYKNKTTGEVTDNHSKAVEWYKKDEIEVWYFSECLCEWVCGIEWVH